MDVLGRVVQTKKQISEWLGANASVSGDVVCEDLVHHPKFCILYNWVATPYTIGDSLHNWRLLTLTTSLQMHCVMGLSP
eukprot:SAG11_NODE_10991_length_791_cov_0.819364_1_plen_79_part_00